MKIHNKAWYMAIGGILALTLVFGGVALFAQSDGSEPDTGTSETPAQDGAGESPLAPPWGRLGQGRFGRGQQDGAGDMEKLAEALGISVEELAAAHEVARAAAIEQAVVDGLITREEADQLLSGELGSGRHGRRGFAGAPGKESFLADALGISEEELQDAMAEVRSAKLDELVESGVLTQEQADLMNARRAVEDYIDREALSEVMQAAYESAVEEAVADGAITQAQAEMLLENQPAFGQNGGPRGFRGGHGNRGLGGFLGEPGEGFHRGPGRGPGTNAPADTSLGSGA